MLSLLLLVQAEKACLAFEDDAECAWCVNLDPAKKGTSTCLPKQAAEYYPTFAKSCKYNSKNDSEKVVARTSNDNADDGKDGNDGPDDADDVDDVQG